MSVHDRASDTRPEWSAYLLSHRNQRAGIKSGANIYKKEHCHKTKLQTASFLLKITQNLNNATEDKSGDMLVSPIVDLSRIAGVTLEEDKYQIFCISSQYLPNVS